MRLSRREQLEQVRQDMHRNAQTIEAVMQDPKQRLARRNRDRLMRVALNCLHHKRHWSGSAR